MGSDGAQGMRKLKMAGAATIAQDEQTCVVYGMPKVAVELGAVDKVLPLERIPQAIQQALSARATRAGAANIGSGANALSPHTKGREASGNCQTIHQPCKL